MLIGVLSMHCPPNFKIHNSRPENEQNCVLDVLMALGQHFLAGYARK